MEGLGPEQTPTRSWSASGAVCLFSGLRILEQPSEAVAARASRPSQACSSVETPAVAIVMVAAWQGGECSSVCGRPSKVNDDLRKGVSAHAWFPRMLYVRTGSGVRVQCQRRLGGSVSGATQHEGRVATGRRCRGCLAADRAFPLPPSPSPSFLRADKRRFSQRIWRRQMYSCDHTSGEKEVEGGGNHWVWRAMDDGTIYAHPHAIKPGHSKVVDISLFVSCMFSVLLFFWGDAFIFRESKIHGRGGLGVA